MYLLIEDDDLLKKCNTIWNKVSPDIKKFDGKPVYSKEFLKTKIKSRGDEIEDFYDKEIPKIDFAVITLNCAVKKMKIYYPQAFFKECKYIEKKLVGHFSGNLSYLSADDECDKE